MSAQRATAVFTVNGQRYSDLERYAEEHLASLGGEWQYRLFVTPLADQFGGAIVFWEAEVTAFSKPSPWEAWS